MVMLPCQQYGLLLHQRLLPSLLSNEGLGMLISPYCYCFQRFLRLDSDYLNPRKIGNILEMIDASSKLMPKQLSSKVLLPFLKVDDGFMKGQSGHAISCSSTSDLLNS